MAAMHNPAMRKFSPVSLTCLLLAMVCVCPETSPAEDAKPASALDFLLTDRSLWELPTAELETRLKPEGLRRDAVSNVVSLGEPREMMEREAKLFGAVNVWTARLEMGTKLNWLTFDLLPPANLAQFLSKADYRNIIKTVEDNAALLTKAKPTIHPMDTMPDPKDKTFKVTAERWVGTDVQIILFAVSREVGPKFTVQRLQLKVGAVASKGEPYAMQPPTLKSDRANGILLLEGMPAEPNWPEKHPEWVVLEQALAAVGKPCDRNGIREYYIYGTSWAGLFIEGMERLCMMSGVKTTTLVPSTWTATELAKIQASCAAAAKKLGKTAPQTLTNLLDVNPDVLRAARATPAALPPFTTAVKQTLESRRPLIWFGAMKLFPQTGLPADAGLIAIRLIIGMDEKQGELIFANAQGQPAARMKIADALASAYLVQAISAK